MVIYLSLDNVFFNAYKMKDLFKNADILSLREIKLYQKL